MCLGSIYICVQAVLYIYLCCQAGLYVARRTDPLHMCLGSTMSTYNYVARRTLYAEIKSPVRDDV